MEGPPLGSGGEDITWPDQVAPRGRKASSTRKIKPQTSNLFLTTGTKVHQFWLPKFHTATKRWWPRGSTLRSHSLLSGALLA